jgi:hypothetical protein
VIVAVDISVGSGRPNATMSAWCVPLALPSQTGYSVRIEASSYPRAPSRWCASSSVSAAIEDLFCTLPGINESIEGMFRFVLTPCLPATHGVHHSRKHSRVPRPSDKMPNWQRFAARFSGLASGLALAVRPAGSALGLQGQRRAAGRVPRSGMLSTVRLEGPTRTMRGVPNR